MTVRYRLALLVCLIVIPAGLVFSPRPPQTVAAQPERPVLKPRALEPGAYILVVPRGTTARLDLPKGGNVIKVADFGGGGMFHDGNRADRDKPTPCGGPVRQWINDEGKVGLQCVKCGKKWPPR